MRVPLIYILLMVTVAAAKSVPYAHVKNGTYQGVHNPTYDIDYFLGVPFAQPPVGNLRLRPPHALNTSWSGVRNATEYGYGCVGYGEDTQIAGGNYVSEDCLTLNMYRPSGYNETSKLPVVFWIYGGGFIEGTTNDGRYNLTFIVERSVRMGKPIMAVSTNYRLNAFGFLLSEDVLKAGVANLGLRDQRQALQWVQENIAAFGGDPSKVTTWGESAGAVSVGAQMIAYDGRDDKLFRGVIAESGSILGLGLYNSGLDTNENNYQDIINRTGCSDAQDKLQCLREVPYEKFNEVVNSTAYFDTAGRLCYGPYPDGDFLTEQPYSLLKKGKAVDVPYLVGDNADECTFLEIFGLQTDHDLKKYLEPILPWPGAVQSAMQLYGVDDGDLVLQSHPQPYNATVGRQFRRVTTMMSDLYFIGARRKTLELLVAQKRKSPVFNYRFNTVPHGVPEPWAVAHFTEIPFVFYNLNGTGYLGTDAPYLTGNQFDGAPGTYLALAKLMSSMWASFVHDGNPNFPCQDAPVWPPYKLGQESQIIFDANMTSSIGLDIWRKKQMTWYGDLLATYGA